MRWWDGHRWTGHIAPARPMTTSAPAAYLVTKRAANDRLHLILTICTGGLWGFVWLWIKIRNAAAPRKTKTTIVY